MTRVVIAAGGTAGHVVPAIAVADALRAEGATVCFIGTRERAEAELVPAAGYEVDFLNVSGLDRRNPAKAIASLGRAAHGVGAARRILRRRQAEAVLGAGGYVAGPVGLAAVRTGIPLVLTEADSHLGLTNRMLARRARRVCLAFPIEGREGDRYLVTGRPVPRAVLDADRAGARRRFEIAEDDRCLAIFGGSLGARSVNEAALDAFLDDESVDRVLHVSGRRDHHDVLARWEAKGSPARYTPISYLPDLGDVLAASDLVVARAGGSIFEIAAAGRPAILIPYPYATGDHQSQNARWMEQGGAAAVIADRELTSERLRDAAADLLGAPRRLAEMAAASRALAKPDAADRIAAEVLGRGEAVTAATGDWRGRRLHFIAIGGAGMSGLALVCHRLGAEVSGSDRADSSYMQRLRDAGVSPAVGHDASQVPEEAEVVVSTAIAEDNPELALARKRSQRVLHRGELLAELCAERRLLAVAGTHGKTTTAAMCIHVLRELGADPSFFLGGELPGAGPDGDAANAGWGEGEWVVAEADESDASFLELRPEVAVVTNLELDHHSRWGSLLELREAFGRFAAPASGLVAGAEVELEERAERRRLSFGLEPGPADLLAEGIEAAGGETRFVARGVPAGRGSADAKVRLLVPGRHNVLNAMAALGAVGLTGAAKRPKRAAKALASFPGVTRRLEHKGDRSGARIYDDYAHHPTEVAAALEAARELEPSRLIAVFQPHLYSRTKALAVEFGAALAAADEIAVLDVYPAREEPVGPLEGVSGRLVAAAAADNAGGRPVWWLPEAELASRALGPRLGEGDLLITIGAGDIYRLAEALVEGG